MLISSYTPTHIFFFFKYNFCINLFSNSRSFTKRNTFLSLGYTSKISPVTHYTDDLPLNPRHVDLTSATLTYVGAIGYFCWLCKLITLYCFSCCSVSDTCGHDHQVCILSIAGNYDSAVSMMSHENVKF